MKHIIFFIGFFCTPFILLAQWNPVSVPTNQGLSAITFTDTLNGFIALGDGSILKSSDGGYNWQSVLTGTVSGLADICFPTASTGYSVSSAGDIIKTINAGNTWSLVNSPTNGDVLRGVFFSNPDTGFICGQAEAIYRTNDGGTTWYQQNSGAYWLRKFSFPTPQTGYCAGDNHLIYKTTDGGLTWNLIFGSGGPNLFNIQFLTVDTGYVCGVNGYAAKSYDGGLTWQVLYTGITTSLTKLWFFNSQTGYCIGASGVILMTTNGGATWTQEIFGGTVDLWGIYFFNQERGFICGNVGTLLTNCVQSPDSITGPTSVCKGDTGKIYSVIPVAGATGYHWSVPSGVIITSGDTTNVITVAYTSNYVSGTFSVSAYNTGCSSLFSPAFSVIVNPIPETPIVTNVGNLLISTTPVGNQWYYNGTLITGAIGQVYDASLSGYGYFWTMVTLEGCSSDTSNHILMTLGVDTHLSSAISVYPVPNDGRYNVSINTGSGETFSISVYDCIGVKIYEETNVVVDHSLQKMIDLRPLPDGVYMMMFENSRNCLVKKIVVNN
jgi:photosystem II stability/assembly factor-like uncharacterized protein